MKYSEQFLPVLNLVDGIGYSDINDLIELKAVIDGVICTMELTAETTDEQFNKANMFYQERFRTTLRRLNKYSVQDDTNEELGDRFYSALNDLIIDLKEAESSFKFFDF